jgi:hypothetical protein
MIAWYSNGTLRDWLQANDAVITVMHALICSSYRSSGFLGNLLSDVFIAIHSISVTKA